MNSDNYLALAIVSVVLVACWLACSKPEADDHYYKTKDEEDWW